MVTSQIDTFINEDRAHLSCLLHEIIVNVYLLERLCGSELIFYRTFTRKMITRTVTLKVNRPTVEWTF